MELHVTVRLPDPEEDALELVVASFADIDKIGARVASAARRWLRSVQVRKGEQRAVVGLAAYFTEGFRPDPNVPAATNGEAKPKPRRKKRAK